MTFMLFLLATFSSRFEGGILSCLRIRFLALLVVLSTASLYGQPATAPNKNIENRAAKVNSRLAASVPLQVDVKDVPGSVALQPEWIEGLRKQGLQPRFVIHNYQLKYRQFLDWALLQQPRSQDEWDSYRNLCASAYRTLIVLKNTTTVFKDVASEWGVTVRLDVEQLAQAYRQNKHGRQSLDVLDQEIEKLQAELYRGTNAWTLRYSDGPTLDLDKTGPADPKKELAFRIEHLRHKLHELVDYGTQKDPLGETSKQLSVQRDKFLLFEKEVHRLEEFRQEHGCNDGANEEKQLREEGRRRAANFQAAVRRHDMHEDPLTK